MLIPLLNPENSAAIAIDCLNTFMKREGRLSIAAYQETVKTKNGTFVE